MVSGFSSFSYLSSMLNPPLTCFDPIFLADSKYLKIWLWVPGFVTNHGLTKATDSSSWVVPPPDEKAHKNQLLISLREIAHWCKFQWPSSMRRHNGHNCILQEVYFKKLLFLYGQIYRWDRHGPKGYRGTYIMILVCVCPCLVPWIKEYLYILRLELCVVHI